VFPCILSFSSALDFLSEISRKKETSLQMLYWQLLRDEILRCASTGEKGDKMQEYIFCICILWANLQKPTSQPAYVVLFPMSHMPIGVYLEAWV